MEYNVGDVVRCMWGTKPVEYEAKIVRTNFASKEYFVHYQGWNKRYDEWISEKSILGASRKQQTPSRCDTPKIRHSRREKKSKKPIDWSPTPCASAHTAEKPAPQKVPNKNHVPISSKRKHSPVPKTKKPPRTSPDLVTMDDLTEESVTSDEECGEYPLPRSYIDVLAKAKKRAERKAQQKMSLNETTFKPMKVASAFVDRNHEEADCGSLHSAQPIEGFPSNALLTRVVSMKLAAHLNVLFENIHFYLHESETSLSLATASSDDVSSTSMECNGVTVSSVGGDHNYSSLRFHYDDGTPPSSAAEKTRGTDQVTSSTRRVHILPVRKPLDIEYTLPYSPSAFKFAKISSNSLIAKPPMIAPTRRPRVDHPPNLGSPFTYCDEYHSSSPISMECNAKGICGERAIVASNFLNVDISDSVTTSSSYSESEDSLSSRQQITGPKSISPFTVST